MVKAAQKNPSIIKNTIYSFIFQLTSVILALVTAPFLSRVLGAEQLGRVNFITAFGTWFSVFSIFGIATYGVRAIARVRHDREQLSKVFSELVVIRFFSTMISIVLYLIVMFSVPRISVEFNLALLQIIVLVGNIFNLDWMFQGLEDYRYIAVRSMIAKIAGVVAIFIFIKTQSNIFIYAVIVAATTALPNLFNIFYVRKTVKISFRSLNLRRHLKPLVFFLITALLINIYMMIDQTLLGFMIKDKAVSDKQVALLTRARLFLMIMMTVPVSISNAAMPRLLVKHEHDPGGYRQLLSLTANITMFFGLALSLGLFFTAKYVLVLVGSGEFIEAELALKIFALSILTVAFGSFNYANRIVAQKKEHMGIYFTIVTAGINLILNIVLIPLMGIVGCAISYVVAEYIGNAIWFWYANRLDKFRVFFRLVNLKYVIAGGVMAGALLLFQWLVPAVTWVNLLLTVLIGAFFYCLTALILKEETVWHGVRKIKNIINRLRRKEIPQTEPAQSESDAQNESGRGVAEPETDCAGCKEKEEALSEEAEDDGEN